MKYERFGGRPSVDGRPGAWPPAPPLNPALPLWIRIYNVAWFVSLRSCLCQSDRCNPLKAFWFCCQPTGFSRLFAIQERVVVHLSCFTGFSFRALTRISIQTAGLAFGGTDLCSYRVRGVDGSCAKHLTVRSFMLLTVILIIISFPSPTHSFIPAVERRSSEILST